MRQQPVRMISWPLAASVALVVVLLAVSPVVQIIAVGACVLAALIGPAQALQALFVATLISYANPLIMRVDPVAGVLLRVVLLVAVLRMLPLIRGSDLRLILPIWLFGLVSVLTSAMVSPALDISIMKVVTFTLAATVVVVGFAHIRAERLARVQSWFLTVGLSVIGLSALTLARPGIGIGGDGGLQGLFSQPQALGIFIAPFAAWSVTGVLLMRRKVSRLELWVAIGTLILVLLTRARTAAAATALAVIVVMLSRALGRRYAQHASLGKPVLIVTVAALVLGVSTLFSGLATKFATEFAYKGTQHEERNLGGAFYSSRGGGILAEWSHFLDSPLLGNGFGVYPDGKFPAGIVRFAGIPLSAPVEKGFLPTAILEEGGLLGAACLALLIGCLCLPAWRAPDLRWRALFVACLAINVGECVFLAPGGIGMLDWLLIGVAITAYRTQSPGVRATQTAPSCGAPRPTSSGGANWPRPAS